ncbi:uncharacterized protein TA04815 [Theileria annulata]|uniref:Uncharacterized protein n=1 Tax=Theileria annulata TaxID=5874 RepID=Q4UBU6_THEAN|nr:uncharacterized protein TA04815 [Theileria annulata]CAI75705.1 hypothetical protein, conserved [Theileria annulata]|eukprot:XP_955181.1 hypothetical protein, conserved [Theileria annulata]
MVKESIMETLSIIYNKKHYNNLVFKSFLIIHKRRRLNEMLNDAEMYGMKEILKNWRLYVITLNKLRENEIKAKIFYESLLYSKYFKLFNQILYRRNIKFFHIMKMIKIIEKNIINNIIKPWNDIIKNYKRLQLCKIHITNNYQIYLKNKIMNEIYKVYNRRIGIYLFDLFILKYYKSIFLESFTNFYYNSLQKEEQLYKNIRIMKINKFFEIWKFNSHYKISIHFYQYKLKSNTFQFIKNYKNIRIKLKKLNILIRKNMEKNLLEKYLNKLLEENKKKLLKKFLLNNFIKIIESIIKKFIFQIMYKNYKINLNEEMNNNLSKLHYENKLKLKIYYKLLENMKIKLKKRNLLTLAIINYKRYLLSKYFNNFIEKYLNKQIFYEKLLFQFNNFKNLLIKRFYFKLLQENIKKIIQLNFCNEILMKNYEEYLKKSIIKRMKFIIEININRKNLLIQQIYNFIFNPVTGSGTTATNSTKDISSTIGPSTVTPGKRANFTAMECTMGKGANKDIVDTINTEDIIGNNIKVAPFGAVGEGVGEVAPFGVGGKDTIGTVETGTVGSSTVMEEKIKLIYRNIKILIKPLKSELMVFILYILVLKTRLNKFYNFYYNFSDHELINSLFNYLNNNINFINNNFKNLENLENNLKNLENNLKNLENNLENLENNFNNLNLNNLINNFKKNNKILLYQLTFSFISNQFFIPIQFFYFLQYIFLIILFPVTVSPVTVLGQADCTTNSTVVPGTKDISSKVISSRGPSTVTEENSTTHFAALGKGANFTAMECTSGKGANSTFMECTTGNMATNTIKDIKGVISGVNTSKEGPFGFGANTNEGPFGFGANTKEVPFRAVVGPSTVTEENSTINFAAPGKGANFTAMECTIRDIIDINDNNIEGIENLLNINNIKINHYNTNFIDGIDGIDGISEGIEDINGINSISDGITEGTEDINEVMEYIENIYDNECINLIYNIYNTNFTNSTKDSKDIGTIGASTVTEGKRANSTLMECTSGKRANSTLMECTSGKRANSTLMECTSGKRANSTLMECTPGKGASFTAMECTTNNPLYTTNSIKKMEYEILMKIPIWRLLRYKYLIKKRKCIYNYWYKLIKKNNLDENFLENFNIIINLIKKNYIIIYWYKLLLTQRENKKLLLEEKIKLEQQEKIKILENNKKFYHIINNLLKKYLSKYYIIIYYNYLINKNIEMKYIIKWNWNYMKKYEINYIYIINLKKLIRNWNIYTKNNIEIKLISKEFNRINILYKSFKIWYNFTSILNKKHEENFLKIKFIINFNNKNFYLKIWYQNFKLNCIGRKKLLKYFLKWNNFIKYKLKLYQQFDIINFNMKKNLLMKYYKIWYENYEKLLIEENNFIIINNKINNNLIKKYYKIFNNYIKKQIILKNIYKKIYEENNLRRKNKIFIIFKFLFSINKLEILLNNLIKNYYKIFYENFLNEIIWIKKLQNYKFLYKLIHYQFLAPNKVLDPNSIVDGSTIVDPNSTVDGNTIVDPNSINVNSIVLGIRILNKNAYYNLRYKLLRNNCLNKLILNYFHVWKSLCNKSFFYYQIKFVYFYPVTGSGTTGEVTNSTTSSFTNSNIKSIKSITTIDSIVPYTLNEDTGKGANFTAMECTSEKNINEIAVVTNFGESSTFIEDTVEITKTPSGRIGSVGPSTVTEVTEELINIRIKYIMKWCIEIMKYWKIQSGVINFDEEILKEIYIFIRTNRVIEALRALQENCLIINLLKVCKTRVEDFIYHKNYKLKYKIFNHLKQLENLNSI